MFAESATKSSACGSLITMQDGGGPKQRYAVLRAKIRREVALSWDADEEAGLSSPGRAYTGLEEFRAAPTLSWLSVSARIDALAKPPPPSRHVRRATPAHLPPLQPREVRPHSPHSTPPARLPESAGHRSHAPTPRAQTLCHGDVCPICLLEFEEEQDAEGEGDDGAPRRASQPVTKILPDGSLDHGTPVPNLQRMTVQWTRCCGRVLHERCVRRLSHCPMCRTWLGVGLAREASRTLSPPVRIRVVAAAGGRGRGAGGANGDVAARLAVAADTAGLIH